MVTLPAGYDERALAEQVVQGHMGSPTSLADGGARSFDLNIIAETMETVEDHNFIAQEEQLVPAIERVEQDLCPTDSDPFELGPLIDRIQEHSGQYGKKRQRNRGVEEIDDGRDKRMRHTSSELISGTYVEPAGARRQLSFGHTTEEVLETGHNGSPRSS